MSTSQTNVHDAGLDYLKAGLQLVALRPNTKVPRYEGWQSRVLSASDLDREFGPDDNIGLQCGAPSGGLIDVDIDVFEAMPLAVRYLPVSSMRHGRPGNPNSHHWYRVDETECTTLQFRDPIDRAMLIEIRGTGGQTMVPPSVHPSGEELHWSGDQTPAKIPLETLHAAVRKIAAGALLARHWPDEGGRNDAGMALGGALIRAGMSEDAAAEFVELVAEAANDEEAAERGATVRKTAEKLRKDEAVTGYTRLKDAVGNAPAALAFQWLREAGEIVGVSEWESPVLFEQLIPPDIPASLLPGPLGAYAQAVADMAEVPEALAVMSVLGVVSTAVARRYMVSPQLGWMEHVNIYTAVALAPGNLKSLVLRKATQPLVEWENKQRLDMQPKVQDAHSKRKSEEAIIQVRRRTAAKEPNSAARAKLVAEIAQMEAELTEIPVLPQLFTNDATPESLATRVVEQGGHYAIISDEGGIIETLAGLYTNGAANVDILLKGIDGGAFRVLRKERAYDLNPVLTIMLAVQPQILTNMAGKRAFHGNGLLDRFFFLVPESKLGRRTLDGPPIPENVANDYDHVITDLLSVEPPRTEGCYHVLELTTEARAAWQVFRGQIEQELRPDGRLFEVSGWAGKLPGFILRITALLHLGAGGTREQEISRAHMDRALKIAELLIEHRLAAQQLMGADPATDDAKHLYEWVRRVGCTQFSRTDCLRANRARVRDKKRLDAALVNLADRRIVNRRAPESAGRPGRPAEIYDVNPQIHEQDW